MESPLEVVPQEVSEPEGNPINAADNSVASNTIDTLIEAKTKELEALIAAQSALVTVNNESMSSEPISSEPMSSESMSTEDMSAEDTSTEDMSAKDTFAEDTSTEPMPTESMSNGPMPNESMPNEPMSTDDTSAGVMASNPFHSSSEDIQEKTGGLKTRRVKFFDMFGLKPVRTRRRRRTVKKTRRRRSRKGSRRR